MFFENGKKKKTKQNKKKRQTKTNKKTKKSRLYDGDSQTSTRVIVVSV